MTITDTSLKNCQIRRYGDYLAAESYLGPYSSTSSPLYPPKKNWKAMHQCDLTMSETESSATAKSEVSSILKSVASLEVKIKDIDKVGAYLESSDIADVLYDVCKMAVKEINHGSYFYLEMFRDPEEGEEHLTLQVRQDFYQENLLDKIEAVWEKYDSLLIDKKGFILVTTDFSPPE